MKARKIIAMLLALVMALALCACGGGSNNNTPDTTPNSDSSSTDTTPKADDGKVYELVVQNHDPATSMCAQYLQDWTDLITEASDGRLTFIIYNGGALGTAGESCDLVLNGTADIAWTTCGMNPGRFSYSDVLLIPGVSVNGNDSAKIAWELYNTSELVQNEWSYWKILSYSGGASRPFSTIGKKIESPSDFKGLRIRATTGTDISFTEACGATAMSFNITDTFENLEKHVADGVRDDWHAMKAFSMADVVDYTTNQTFGTGHQCMIMNWDSYNNLPDDLRAILDEYSGEYAAKMAGEYWDSCQATEVEILQEAGVELYDLSQEVQDFCAEACEKAFDQWVESMNSQGYDGNAIARDYRNAVKNAVGYEIDFLEKYA